MAKCLLKNGFIVPEFMLRKVFGSELEDILRDKLRIVYTPKIGGAVVIPLYRRVTYNKTICYHLPRGYMYALTLRATHLPPPKIMFNPVASINAKFVGELDSNQKIVHGELMTKHFTPENIANGSAAALLRMEAGYGKTFVAAALIGSLRMKTLYIVARIALAAQAVADMRSVLHDCSINIYSKDMAELPDIAVVVINTALNMPPDVARQFSMVIYDELQTYCSDSRREIFRATATWVNLGMSATTTESRGFDMVYRKELAYRGEIIAADLPGWNPVGVHFNITVRLVHYYGPPEYTEVINNASTGRMSALHMIKQFISDPWRTKLISRELAELYTWKGPGGEQHNIFVFCEERGQLETIFNALKDNYAILAPELDDNKASLIGGMTSKQTRAALTSKARVILTTYGYSTFGISKSEMTAMIRCTPRRNTENSIQLIGRILRRNGDPTIPRVIVDIIDANTPLAGQLQSRMVSYRTRPGVKFEKITTDWTEFA